MVKCAKKRVPNRVGQQMNFLGRTSLFRQRLRLDERKNVVCLVSSDRNWNGTGLRIYALVRPVAWPDLRSALQNMEAKYNPFHLGGLFIGGGMKKEFLQYMAPVRFVITRKITLLPCTDAKYG
jgi:hypothetical protein